MCTPVGTKGASREGGFILVELSLIIVMVGIFIGAAVPFYKLYTQRNATIVTQKRMEVLAKGFSSYIQMRWRLPCPADPASASGAQFGVERTPSCTTEAEARGIVPYRTLGIPEEYARDGYGNFFTYIVSPDFTRDTRLGVAPDQVNERLAHLVGDNKFAILPIAQFCAPLVDSGNDLSVQQQDGGSLYIRPGGASARDTTNVPRSTGAGGTGTPHPSIRRENIVTSVAMALISHGRNGAGSLQADGSQRPGPSGASEAATNAIDRIVQLQRGLTDVGANQYDDIIQFYTQDEIYAASGGDSCENL